MYHIYGSKKINAYQGLSSLHSYIMGCVLSEKDKDNYLYHTVRELHTFLTLSFVKLNSLDIKWDRFVSLSKIHIIGFPDFKSIKNNLILFIERKENENMFIISHLQLNKFFPDLIEYTNFKNISPNESFKLLSVTYEFVDSLYSEALSVVKEINFNENGEADIKPVVNHPFKSVKNEIVENKFDKSNYIQL